MPGNIDLLKETLSQVYPRRPALKKKMLKAMTDVLIKTPSDRLRGIACVSGEIEACFVAVLTKYVKRNPASADSLTSLCSHATQLSDIVLTVLNTKTSPVSCIQQGYSGSFTNLEIIRNKIETNLLGEENETG